MHSTEPVCIKDMPHVETESSLEDLREESDQEN